MVKRWKGQWQDKDWKVLQYIFAILVMVLVCMACRQEDKVPAEGEPAMIRLNVKEGRATGTPDENTIGDLHVLVYQQGKLVGQKYATTNPLTVMARSGKCRIYVIANTEDKNFFAAGRADTEEKLKALVTEELETLPGLKAPFVMTGSIEKTFPSGTTPINETVTVQRLVSQINLNIKTENGITITNYKLVSLPAKSWYIPQPMANEEDTPNGETTDPDTSGSGTDATGQSWKNAPAVEATADNNTDLSTTFYMYENRVGFRKQVEGGTGDVTDQTQKAKYAPEHATYVEITGKGDGFEAKWKVYLGGDNAQNYNVKRNCKYTYNITLKDAHNADTRVEATYYSWKIAIEAPGESTDNLYLPPVSNCYMVKPGESVNVPVIRANQSDLGVQIQNVSDKTEWKAEIVWQTEPDLVKVVTSEALYKIGAFQVQAVAGKPGNAVVAVMNKATNEILWSWHIWITGYEPETDDFSFDYNGTHYTFMTHPMGALSNMPKLPESAGLLYQWGRKDPFPHSAEVLTGVEPILYNASNVGSYITIKDVNDADIVSRANNLELAIRNPVTIYFDSSPNEPVDWYSSNDATYRDDLWGCPDLATVGNKTVYDPCPAGWRVPDAKNGDSPFSYLTNANFPPILENGSFYGRQDITGKLYANTGSRKASAGTLDFLSVHSYTSWLATCSNFRAYWATSNATNINKDSGHRSNAISVRCVKETSIPMQTGKESNSYLIPPRTGITIPVSQANRSTDLGTQVTPTASDWTAEVVWQSAPGLVTVSVPESLRKQGRFEAIAARNRFGNAVVAIKKNNQTLWSWHIWVTDYTPNTANKWMDRNLGALGNSHADGVLAYGLLYQWGRKDPFPGVAYNGKEGLIYDASNKGYYVREKQVNNTNDASVFNISYAAKHPEVYIGLGSNLESYDWLASANSRNDLWGSELISSGGSCSPTVKTIYDPCPYGWKIPSYGDESWGQTADKSISSNWKSGYVLDIYGGWYPAAGYYRLGFGQTSGDTQTGYYWTASVHFYTTVNAICGRDLTMDSSGFYPGIDNYKVNAFPIRCVRNTSEQ